MNDLGNFRAEISRFLNGPSEEELVEQFLEETFEERITFLCEKIKGEIKNKVTERDYSTVNGKKCISGRIIGAFDAPLCVWIDREGKLNFIKSKEDKEKFFGKYNWVSTRSNNLNYIYIRDIMVPVNSHKEEERFLFLKNIYKTYQFDLGTSGKRIFNGIQNALKADGIIVKYYFGYYDKETKEYVSFSNDFIGDLDNRKFYVNLKYEMYV